MSTSSTGKARKSIPGPNWFNSILRELYLGMRQDGRYGMQTHICTASERGRWSYQYQQANGPHCESDSHKMTG